MKIGIVTVYKSDNYGAFWQAFALKGYLESLGHEVLFIKHNARNLKLKMARDFGKAMLERKPLTRNLPFLWSRLKAFQAADTAFSECSIKDSAALNLIVLGSDEIWNVQRHQIYNYPVFSGEGLVPAIISYAPSVNQATVQDFMNHPVFLKNIKRLLAISVRDQLSEKVIKAVTGRNDVVTVLDPTLLVESSFYALYKTNFHINSPYILIYSYGDHISAERIRTLQTYAARKGLKTVSVLSYLDWCDMNCSVSPYEMLSLFENAELVATDTFHGLMFSIVFQKDYYMVSGGSPKVQSVLNDFFPSNHHLEGSLDRSCNNPIDYGQVDSVVLARRAASADFLAKALSAASC